MKLIQLKGEPLNICTAFTKIFNEIEVLDEKIIYIVLISPLLLFGCSPIDHHLNKTSRSIPEEMPASKYRTRISAKSRKVLSNMRRNTEKNMKTRRTIL